MDHTKAFSADNGFIVDEENGGPFYTGGTASPVGQGLPSNTVYSQATASGIIVWQKNGAGDTSTDWRLYPAESISFDNTGPIFTESNPTNVQDAIEAGGEKAQAALDTPRYAITLQYNGTVGNNTFFGYSNLIPGDATPIVVPVKSELIEYSFSNSSSNADYTLEIRKNSTISTILDTQTKVNTQFFVRSGLAIPFNSGDTIFCKYIDDGNNASDAAMVLFFKAVPE